MVPVIAITGGPCGGKTTVLNRFVSEFSGAGCRVEIIPESATYLMRHENIFPWEDEFLFQCRALELHFKWLEEARWRIEAFDGNGVIICDRGGPDGAAYVDATMWAKVLAHFGHTKASLFGLYDGAIHLVTAAEGAEEYYTLATNEMRREATLEDAVAADHRTRQVWLAFLHYRIVYNPETGGFDAKVHSALNWARRRFALGTGVHKEIEHKFEVHNTLGEVEKILERVKVFGRAKVIQNYLIPGEDGAVIRRVRMIVHDDESTEYVYEEKRATDLLHVRDESDPRKLTEEEYEILLCEERDRNAQTIVKVRTRFPHGRHTIELDVVEEPVRRIYLEIETNDPNEVVEAPSMFSTTRVTGLPGHSMYDIARGIEAVAA